MRSIVLAFLFAALAIESATGREASLRIDQGPLLGAIEDGVEVYKDIPYAAAPVGLLRWRAPQPAPAWTRPRDANDFGPICPQNQRLGFFTPRLMQSEDCLTLNVWTPKAEAVAKLPVMVWIHGGGFIEGGSAIPLYDGTDLAKHGVVVVSFNYRLGELGFFAHPAVLGGKPGEESGNFGLLDQIAALEWVKRNIASFGGDPANVTIFGESAGGMSVNDLMASPLARGLFAKAISESGLGLQAIPTRGEAEQAGLKFAHKLGVAGEDARTAGMLRRLKVSDILGKQGGMGGEGRIAPYIDGKTVPSDVSLLFAKGAVALVPYIDGSNSNEASLAPALGMDPVEGLKLFGPSLPKVRSIYEADGPLSEDEFARQAFGDALFTAAAQTLAGFVDRAGAPARVYQFAYVADSYRGEVPGVSHGGELIYVFGLRGLGGLADRASAKDRAMIAAVQSYWTNFAKTGDPNGAGLPPWPRYSPDRQETLVFDDETKAIVDFRKAQVGVMKAGWMKRVGYAGP
ncbi:MAG TPA: carboxylesterase family protein [Rhizomicrobium sp.]|nr:carboxylesterase family protein [Rhizomicrobium sp.]